METDIVTEIRAAFESTTQAFNVAKTAPIDSAEFLAVWEQGGIAGSNPRHAMACTPRMPANDPRGLTRLAEYIEADANGVYLSNAALAEYTGLAHLQMYIVAVTTEILALRAQLRASSRPAMARAGDPAECNQSREYMLRFPGDRPAEC